MRSPPVEHRTDEHQREMNWLDTSPARRAPCRRASGPVTSTGRCPALARCGRSGRRATPARRAAPPSGGPAAARRRRPPPARRRRGEGGDEPRRRAGEAGVDAGTAAGAEPPATAAHTARSPSSTTSTPSRVEARRRGPRCRRRRGRWRAGLAVGEGGDDQGRLAMLFDPGTSTTIPPIMSSWVIAGWYPCSTSAAR